MDFPSLDLVTLLFKLLPGFVALAIFHALTAYPKRGAFDRIIAALIFTLVAELGVAVIKATLLWIGSLGYSLCPWSDHVQLGWAAGVGVLSGVAWAYAVNKGYTHRLARRWGITKKSSDPTEWFGAFSRLDRWVILHLKDGRRLMGWPHRWPDDPEVGHFLLESPGWVLEDATEAAMPEIEALLISAKDVETVEFLRFSDDPVLKENEQEIESTATVLAKTRKET